jgi:MoaA/NifB/PqqE/SkfB family radical SAM enzyme
MRLKKQVKAMIDYYKLYYTLEHVYTSISRHLPGCYALPPLQVVFELTYRCNLKCQFCYQRRQVDQLGVRASDKARELTADEIKETIRHTPPWSLVVFTGGEPLLRKDALDIITYAAKRRRCHIVTNGTYITTEVAEALVDSGIMSVGISLDGGKELHDMIRGVPGTFERALQAMRDIHRFRVDKRRKWPLLNVKTTISHSNVGRLQQVVAIAEEIPADFCTFQMLNNSVYLSGLTPNDDLSLYTTKPEPIEDFDLAALKQELAALVQPREKKPIIRFIPDLSPEEYVMHYDNRINPKDYWCRTPWATLNISAYGDVFPCLNYHVGNLQTEGLAKVWNNARFRAFRQAIRRHGLFPNCVGCCDLQAH